MINIGGNIGEMYVGNISIGSAYVGSQLVWQKEQDDYDPYDMSEFVSGRLYTSPAGSIRAGASYTTSGFYPIVAGHSYEAYAKGGSRNYTYGYTYNADKGARTRYQVASGSLKATFTAAAADAYFRMTFMVSGVADSYIKDTTTGKYLFKGENL